MPATGTNAIAVKHTVFAEPRLCRLLYLISGTTGKARAERVIISLIGTRALISKGIADSAYWPAGTELGRLPNRFYYYTNKGFIDPHGRALLLPICSVLWRHSLGKVGSTGRCGVKRTKPDRRNHLAAARFVYRQFALVSFTGDHPLVIMSNDADGAVPWYQGIELFTAMRRLNKPVWLLDYNNEAHNLVEQKEQERYTDPRTAILRLAAERYTSTWITEGVPAVMKGQDLGLE